MLRWQRARVADRIRHRRHSLGGYVRMLDEREAPVAPRRSPPGLQHPAAATRARAAIVAAGPVANLLLAVLLYATGQLEWVDEPKAVLASPGAGSIAQQAGLHGANWCLAPPWAREDFRARALV